MKDLNKVFLLGRLGADPEVRSTQSGLSFARFSLATARRVREGGASQMGEQAWTEETQWHRVIAWGKLADAVQKISRKGQTVLVEGALRQRKYESKDGRPQISFEVHADEISFLNVNGNNALRAQRVQSAESASLADMDSAEAVSSENYASESLGV
jgi:single-strand DNA-binding protein